MENKASAIIIDVVPAVTRNIRAHMRCLAQPDLTILQLRVLSKLSQHSMTNNELAHWMGISKATMSRALKTMCKKGLITRKTAEKDKRETEIKLTSSGSSKYLDIQRRVQKIIAEKVMTISEEKRRELLKGLKILSEIFGI